MRLQVPVMLMLSALYGTPCKGLKLKLTAGLTRKKSPWVLSRVEWEAKVVRQAVIWLARSLEKPILKLTDTDYNENSLQVLLSVTREFMCK